MATVNEASHNHNFNCTMRPHLGTLAVKEQVLNERRSHLGALAVKEKVLIERRSHLGTLAVKDGLGGEKRIEVRRKERHATATDGTSEDLSTT